MKRFIVEVNELTGQIGAFQPLDESAVVQHAEELDRICKLLEVPKGAYGAVLSLKTARDHAHNLIREARKEAGCNNFQSVLTKIREIKQARETNNGTVDALARQVKELTEAAAKQKEINMTRGRELRAVFNFATGTPYAEFLAGLQRIKRENDSWCQQVQSQSLRATRDTALGFSPRTQDYLRRQLLERMMAIGAINPGGVY